MGTPCNKTYKLLFEASTEIWIGGGNKKKSPSNIGLDVKTSLKGHRARYLLHVYKEE